MILPTMRGALTRRAARSTLSRNAGEGLGSHLTQSPSPSPRDRGNRAPTGPRRARPAGRLRAWWVRGFQAGILATALSAAATAETIPEPLARLEGLDKITARVSKFDAPVDKRVRFGTLAIRVRDCEKNPPEESPESAAFVEIDELRPGEDKARRVFSGWMFASSPALSALEHPVYDVVLLDCKAASGSPQPAAGSSAGKDARQESASPSKR
jgi:hypothetical protein